MSDSLKVELTHGHWIELAQLDDSYVGIGLCGITQRVPISLAELNEVVETAKMILTSNSEPTNL